MNHRQLPQDDELFLDHVGYFVPDIAGCAAGFARLGFTVSGVNTHYNTHPDGTREMSGTANRLIVLERGYVEILGRVAETPLGRQLDAALARYAGVHLIAFAHADVTKREAELRAAGIDLQQTVRLQRPVQIAAGERQARFTVVRTAPGVFPEGRVQMMTHHTPELVWLPDITDHPNRATALTGLLLVQADVAAAVARWERFTGARAATANGIATLALDRGSLALCDAALPEMALPSLPYGAVLALASGDLAATAAALRERGVTPIRPTATSLLVGPDDALGSTLLFHAPGVDPWDQLAR